MESRVKADGPRKIDTHCEVDVDKFAAQSGMNE
jgi:hypothetical protein